MNKPVSLLVAVAVGVAAAAAAEAARVIAAEDGAATASDLIEDVLKR